MNRILFLPLILLFANLTQAQSDSNRQISNNIQDSLFILKSQQLQQMTALRIADSVKRAELEHQIRSLNASDNLKKNELLQELALLIVHATVTVGYDVHWTTVHALLIRAASLTPPSLKRTATLCAAKGAGRLLCVLRNQCLYQTT